MRQGIPGRTAAAVSVALALAAPAIVDAGQPLRLQRHAYVDRDGIGREAFSFLMPAGWRFDGGIRWALDQPAMPAVASFTVRDPKAGTAFEAFPNRMFSWSTDPMMQASFPPGSRYLGSEVRQPLAAAEYLRGVLLPQFRRDVSDLRILEATPLPDLGKQMAQAPPIPGATATSDAAKLRLEYVRGGVPMEEEMYVILQYVNIPVQSLYGFVTNSIWTADYQFAFVARKGQLGAQRTAFETIVASFRLDPTWYAKYNQLVQVLTQQQIQRINQIGEISRIVARTNDEVSDMIRGSWEKQQATYDEIHANFSQYVRGVDEYQDPIQGRPVELPSGYTQAWANPLGEYIVSDDANFDPNVGSNGSWQRLEKKR